MRVERAPDVEAFLARAGAFLAAREAEHNLIYGICANLAADPTISESAPYLATVVDGDRVVAAAIRTPPWNLVLSEMDDARAIDALVDDLAGDAVTAAQSGVHAPIEWAPTFADAWTTRTGQTAISTMLERIYRLSVVIPARETPGEMRVADRGDRDLLIGWVIGFHDDAFRGRPHPSPEVTVDRWLAGQRTMYLWQDAGEPVSMCGIGGRTPNGIRVGPVYTPGARRERGYAGALVAAASQAQLDAGRRFCFLFTDLANPTSNSVYQRIGYEPVRDVEVFRFD